MFEKRIQERSAIELAASFGIPDDSPALKSAKVINVSTGGFCFFSSADLKEGERIQLNLDLDEQIKINIGVKVAWIKASEQQGKNMIGVQIVDQDGPDLDKFLEFYNTNIKTST